MRSGWDEKCTVCSLSTLTLQVARNGVSYNNLQFKYGECARFTHCTLRKDIIFDTQLRNKSEYKWNTKLNGTEY